MSSENFSLPTDPEALADYYRRRADELDCASCDIDARAWESYWQAVEAQESLDEDSTPA
jgi:hypothetical protein